MVSSPIVSTDITERQARLLFFITRACAYLAVLLTVVMFIAWLISPGNPQLLVLSLLVSPIWITAFLYPVFYKRGQPRTGGMLFVIVSTITLTITTMLIPAFITIYLPALVAIIMISYNGFGSQNGKWFAIGSIVGLVLAMITKYIAPLNLFKDLPNLTMFLIDAFMGVFILAVLWILIRVTTLQQEENLTKLEQANKWLDTAAGESTQGRDRLQEVIKQFESYMSQVSSGDLLARLSIDGGSYADNDPIQSLGKGLTAMTHNLHDMILKIKEASQNITSASTQILAANTEQVASATQTSASVAETTTTVEELKALADHVLNSTSQMAESAQRTVEVSRAGRQSVTSTIQSMVEIRGRVEGIAESILALSEKTQQIGEIIAMVGDLASQTNMLALNASIEASRAGEAGKGFGVVAQEMRTLAEQSRRATTQIKEIISEIQSATNSTVMATEEGSKVVDRGVKQAETAQQSIDQLAAAIDENDQIFQQISAGGRQQLAGVEQVAMTMQHINQATMQNVSSSRQTEGAARNLTQLAQSLVEEIAKYKV